MVPPQFTANAASRDREGPHAVTGIPVFAYCEFSKATPKGIPYSDTLCLAPTGSSLGGLGYVLIFIIVLTIQLPLFYHLQLTKSTVIAKFLTFFAAFFHGPGKQKNIRKIN